MLNDPRIWGTHLKWREVVMSARGNGVLTEHVSGVNSMMCTLNHYLDSKARHISHESCRLFDDRSSNG